MLRQSLTRMAIQMPGKTYAYCQPMHSWVIPENNNEPNSFKVRKWWMRKVRLTFRHNSVGAQPQVLWLVSNSDHSKHSIFRLENFKNTIELHINQKWGRKNMKSSSPLSPKNNSSFFTKLYTISSCS